MLNRRQLLETGLAASLGLVGVPAISYGCDQVLRLGWEKSEAAYQWYITRFKRPFLAERSPRLTQTGKGRIVLLHKYLERALGRIVPHYQSIGDCVGQGYGFGVDTLSATQIYALGRAEQFKAKASTEFIYAGSRYEIGMLEHGFRTLLRGDGSIGAFAAEFVRKYGVLVRGVYGDIDLTKYDAGIARAWGRTGVPDELEPLAKIHPVRSYALVRTYEEARDAITNGYPVVICSNVGFNPSCRKCNPGGGRDEMGFLHRCGTWWHCMCLVAVDDTMRPGCLCMNSWGPNWVGGPKRHDQPDGSFWIDAETVNEICNQGDSFAISNYLGFPAQKIDYHLF